MKFPMVLSVLSLALASAFAQAPRAHADASVERALDSAELRLESSRATLVRTSSTPARVRLTVPHRVFGTECVRHEAREVRSAHPSCGSVMQPRCTLESYGCRTEFHCSSAPGESRHDCSLGAPREVDCQYRQACHDEETNLICAHTEQVCVEEKEVFQAEDRTLDVVFKRAAKLKGGETETFEVELADFKAVDAEHDGQFRFRKLDTRRKYRIDDRELRYQLQPRVIVKGRIFPF